jgi:hypothetical protein
MALEPLKISAMTPVVTLTGAEHIPVVQAGLNKYTTPDQIKGYYAYYYESVNTYADLPDATLHASEIYIVLTSTGVWLVNRKDAGLYYSNGAAWVRLGDIPSYFNSANFQIYDGINNTKVAKFDLTGITTATTRTYTLPDSDGTLALTNHTHTYLPLTGGTLTGHLLFTDNTYDIGASDATRPRTGYFGTSVRSPLFEGGTAAGSYITYKATTSTGTTTGIAHQFKGGTDGGTVIATMLNNGDILVGLPSIMGPKVTIARATVPTVISKYTEYLHIGGSEWGLNTYRIIGFGNSYASNTKSPAYIGYQETDSNGETAGDLIFGTRSVTTDSVPNEQLRISRLGNISVGGIIGTARLHLPAGTATASTQPLKFTTGVALTTPELGAVGFTDPQLYMYLTDGTVQRRNFVFDNGTLLTSGRIPVVADAYSRLTSFAGLTYSDSTGLALIKPLIVTQAKTTLQGTTDDGTTNITEFKNNTGTVVAAISTLGSFNGPQAHATLSSALTQGVVSTTLAYPLIFESTEDILSLYRLSGSFTVDNSGAAHCTITWANHKLAVGAAVVFSNITGATGITAGTVYYVATDNFTTSTFELAATFSAAAPASTIHTSATGSGTCTCVSRIYVAEAGDYLFNLSSILNTTNNTAATMDIWFVKGNLTDNLTGTNIAKSNTQCGLGANTQQATVAVPLILDVVAGDFIRLDYCGSSNVIQWFALGTQVSPTRPAMPSVILTVNKIGS